MGKALQDWALKPGKLKRRWWNLEAGSSPFRHRAIFNHGYPYLQAYRIHIIRWQVPWGNELYLSCSPVSPVPGTVLLNSSWTIHWWKKWQRSYLKTPLLGLISKNSIKCSITQFSFLLSPNSNLKVKMLRQSLLCDNSLNCAFMTYAFMWYVIPQSKSLKKKKSKNAK